MAKISGGGVYQVRQDEAEVLLLSVKVTQRDEGL